MLGAQRIAVYGGDDQRSLQSLALTQGQPVTAEREGESSSCRTTSEPTERELSSSDRGQS